MHIRGESNHGIWRKRRWLCRALAAPCVLCWIGCAGTPSRLSGDPLVGGGPALTANTGGDATAKLSAPLPPLPAPNSTASNAALASNPGRPLDGRHDLQINDPRQDSSNPNWSVPGGNAAPLPQDRAVTPAYASANGSRLGSFEQAKAQLDARGVTWYRLESGEPGMFKFSCSVPNRHNRTLSRTHEAQAASELAAIQAVLDQIDRER